MAGRDGDGAAGDGRPDVGLLLGVTLLVTTWYVLMEWLFFATTMSFLSALEARQRLLLPGAATALLAAAAVVVTTLAAAPTWLGRGTRVAGLRRRLALAVPAAILSVSLLLLLDNFVHTLLGTGLTSLWGRARWLRPLLSGLLFAACLGRLEGWVAAAQRRPRPRRALVGAALVAGALAAASLALFPRQAPAGAHGGGCAGASSSPRQGKGTSPPATLNVLLLGGDGIEAAHTSLYGYGPKTTPFLESLASEVLLAENAYPNAPVTGASLTSILTGMPPTRTGVIYPPDIARGEAARQHLPGILRARGYARAQFTIRYYGDAGDLNLGGSFEEANGRRLEAAEWTAALGLGRLAPSLRLFLTILAERVRDRVLPSRSVGALAYAEAKGEGGSFLPDDERVQALSVFLEEAREPFLAHLHLMATHGPRFDARSRVASAGRAGGRSESSYDDAILDFDGHVDRIVRLLRRRALLERTLVVVYSDHGPAHSTQRPVPLLFRFPHGAHAGRIHGLTQLIDVAPTILDAIGIPPPRSMGGWSLLRGEPPCRPVLSASANYDLVDNRGLEAYVVPRPPFFSLGTLTLLDGHRSYALDVTRDRLEVAPLPAAPWCPEMSAEAARSRLVAALLEGGYDVASLRPAAVDPRATAMP